MILPVPQTVPIFTLDLPLGLAPPATFLHTSTCFTLPQTAPTQFDTHTAGAPALSADVLSENVSTDDGGACVVPVFLKSCTHTVTCSGRLTCSHRDRHHCALLAVQRPLLSLAGRSTHQDTTNSARYQPCKAARKPAESLGKRYKGLDEILNVDDVSDPGCLA